MIRGKNRDADGEIAEFLSQQLESMRAKTVTCQDLLLATWPEGSAMSKLQREARRLQADEGLTFREAFSFAVMQNPRLYEAYLKESGLS